MKQEVVITDVSQCQKDIGIEVSAEEVKKEFEKTYDAYMRYVKVPGFRPGRVPRDVVKQRFSKEIKDEVVGQLLPHALQHAVTDHQLRIVGEPHLKEMEISEGAPFKFKVGVEVLPEIELKEYKGVKATKRVAQVKEEDVDKAINTWRENFAEFVPIEDRPSKDGDFVSVNLVGKYLDPQEEHEKEDLKAEGIEIELGAEATQPEFTENLRGVKPDDVREFRVTYPEDFNSKGLAGKTVDFTATVLSVREKELPELNDEFAKRVGDYETAQEMRDKIRESLAKNAGVEADNRLREDVLTQLLETHEFDVPTVLVNEGAENRLRDFSNMLARMGMPAEVARNINWQERISEAKADAKRDVRAALLVSKIADAEGVNVSSDEVDAEIELMAQSTGQTAEQVKARLTREEAISSIESRLRYRKALDVILSSAEVTIEDIPSDSSAEPGQKSPEALAAVE
ncbi:MAG: trigger factor [Acidobacteria bacterium]|nr:trigger factor [Acidobacteriota bacterium]